MSRTVKVVIAILLCYLLVALGFVLAWPHISGEEEIVVEQYSLETERPAQER